ncbi:FAD-binding protein, partial [bacterium]|nr:FAD-binding protein [bacterium]
IANMEFNQFHPTCLYAPGAGSFLLTEAIRGEGGFLQLADGTRFMPHWDPRAELAPRDIVARAIDYEMKRLGEDCVYLDIRHKDADFIKKRFPNIYQACLTHNLDLTKDRIPVVPAAHYTCGGVQTDLNGATNIGGLYAIGETACTGFHGANRMASNSLLECFVFARSAADAIGQQMYDYAVPDFLPPWDDSRVCDPDELVVIAHNWSELRRCMWDYVGIVRTNKRLHRAKRRIDLLRQEIDDHYRHFSVTRDLLELRNLVEVADLMVQCALLRKESRGLHYTLDYPMLDTTSPPQDTVLIP